jgi:fibronectin-binding autotransporter adhesin
VVDAIGRYVTKRARGAARASIDWKSQPAARKNKPFLLVHEAPLGGVAAARMLPFKGMNIAFTSVWNSTLGAWVAASEITRVRGKRARSGAAGTGASAARTTAAVLLAAGLGAVAMPSWAFCTQNAATVTCSGAPNPLAPSFSNGGSDLAVNVDAGAALGVLLGLPGNAMRLSGSNIELHNRGSIDPSFFGPTTAPSGGVRMGNASVSNQTIANDGIVRGTRGVIGAALNNLDGLALVLQNGGASKISNAGTIETTALKGGGGAAADAPLIAVYGGGSAAFTNNGTITGRIALQDGAAHTFVNAGTLQGSVSMGAGGKNTFSAVTGASVGMGDSTGAPLLPVLGMGLGFAATGTVDGGAGGNNTLRLQNDAAGGDATTTGTGTLPLDRYGNFQHVAIGGGTWTLTGAADAAAADFSFAGGLATFNAAAAFGAASMVGNGGAIEATANGITLNNAVRLPGNLVVQGANDLTLAGVIDSSGGRIIKTGTGTLVLSADNTVGAPDTGLGGAGVRGGTLVAVGNGLASATTNVDNGAGLASTLRLAPGATTWAVNLSNGGVLQNAGTINPAGHNHGSVAVGAGGGIVVNSGSVFGPLPVAFTDGGTLDNAGGTVTGGTRGVQFTGAAGEVNNTLGGSITASSYAVSLYNGGKLVNSGNSTITSTGDAAVVAAGGLLDLANMAGSTIEGAALGVAVIGSAARVNNAGQIRGRVSLDTGSVNHVTLTSGGQIAGALVIGAKAGSTLTLDGTGNQSYAQAVTSSTDFGGALVKDGSGTWTIDRQLAPASATINAGTLALGAGGKLAGTAVDIAAAGATFANSAGGAQTIGDLRGVAGSTLSLGAVGDSLGFGTAADTLIASTVTGAGVLIKNGAGTVTLTGDNSGFSGGLAANGGGVDITAANALGTGALGIGGAVALGTAGPMTLANNVNLSNGAALSLGNASSLTLGGDMTGGGALVKNGAGVLSLAGAHNSFQGGTTLNAGTLRLANNDSLGGGALTVGGAATLDGSAALFLPNDVTLDAGAALTLASNNVLAFNGTVSGTGSLVKNGSSLLVLTQGNSYGGGTTVNSGTLSVVNAAGSATGSGAVQVNAGAQLTGGGTISGPVSIAGGARLSVGNGVGQMATGALTLAAGSNVDFDLGQAGTAGGTLNDLLDVSGNLVLGGSVNVTQSAGGLFGAGLYRLINYTGTLTDNGIAIGTAPVAASSLVLQTSVAHQVNLINTSGLTLNMWDGGNSANYNDGKVSGGSGTWRTGAPADGWTDAGGIANAPWTQDGLAIFAGAAGTVTVDNKGAGGVVRVGGAQFASDGYTVAGDALTITTASTNLRVGDGTAASAGMTATINSVITGAGGIAKEDGGTLTLGGANTYAGGTTVRGGVLQISSRQQPWRHQRRAHAQTAAHCASLRVQGR